MRRRLASIALASAMCIGLAPSAGAAPLIQLSQSTSFGLDHLGRPNAALLAQLKKIAATLPPEAQSFTLSAIAFFEGTGTSGVDLPDQAPGFTQFYWPTIAGQCIQGSLNSVGSAIAVPGPADIPSPGAKAGETVFLFTALGTQPAAEQQGMSVKWLNLDRFVWGETTLSNTGINPDGPATISGTAQTGSGRILAVIEGRVQTTESNCAFAPTLAYFEVK